MEPFVGQIMMVGFNFAPRGWALCDGQLLPVASNTALFSLLGTAYGGDGRTTFGLPDLRGAVPMHAGNGPGRTDRRMGARGGAEQVTLTAEQLPAHSHTITSFTNASEPGVSTSGGTVLEPATPMTTDVTTSSVGAGQPVTVLPPFQVVNFIIALQGVYPSRP